MRSLLTLLIVLAMTNLASTGWSAEYHVCPTGNDKNLGSQAKPFRSIQKAANVMAAGDTCIIHGGLYRETVQVKNSGKKGKPIRFVAAEGEKVILDGTEPIKGKWSIYKGNIYKIKVSEPIEQLFVDRKMMIEARWPNMRFDQILDRSTWARAGEGSRYGKMIDPNLAGTDIDWTGAVATLNIAHQFRTWTRPVETHIKGSDTFTYPKDIKSITRFVGRTRELEDDYYYLSGKLEALDAPTEWFHDQTSGVLYLYADDGKNPTARKIEYRKRNYAFEVQGCEYIELCGLHFFATTFGFSECNHCVVDGCHLLYPAYSRHLIDRKADREVRRPTYMQGNHNAVRNTSIAYSNMAGLRMTGGDNLVENCIIHDVCWSGSLSYPALFLVKDKGANSSGSIARRNTLYNSGGAILCYRQGSHIIEYNHVYDGGLASKDVALVYTGQPDCAGSIVRYNWVHGCRNEGRPQWNHNGGLGIRGDDQTRRLTVHHNVVWDCGRDGIIIKGDHNRAYNNTVFDIGSDNWTGSDIDLNIAPEPKKPWRAKRHPLLPVQNSNSEIFNNAAYAITGYPDGKPFPKGNNVANNCQELDFMLEDIESFDFRPKAGSPLIDAGRIIEGFTDDYKGKAPDIGAYEYGGRKWTAGANWTDKK